MFKFLLFARVENNFYHLFNIDNQIQKETEDEEIGAMDGKLLSNFCGVLM